MDTIKPIDSQLQDIPIGDLPDESSTIETAPLQQDDKKEELAKKVDAINKKKGIL